MNLTTGFLFAGGGAQSPVQSDKLWGVGGNAPKLLESPDEKSVSRNCFIVSPRR